MEFLSFIELLKQILLLYNKHIHLWAVISPVPSLKSELSVLHFNVNGITNSINLKELHRIGFGTYSTPLVLSIQKVKKIETHH